MTPTSGGVAVPATANESSSRIRCCGSSETASCAVIRNNSASNSSYPERNLPKRALGASVASSSTSHRSYAATVVQSVVTSPSTEAGLRSIIDSIPTTVSCVEAGRTAGRIAVHVGPALAPTAVAMASIVG